MEIRAGHAVGQGNDGALGTGDRTLDSDQIVLGVNLDNRQVLHGDPHKAHVAGQTLAGEHAGRGGSGAVGTGMPCDGAGAVALAQTVLTVALDNALVALALGDACDVNLIASGEDVSLQDIAHVQAGDILQTELAQGLLGGDIGLLEVASGCLVDLLGGNLAEAQLNSLIAVALDGLLLHDGAGTRLDDGHGNDLAVLVEQLSHTDFFADNAFNHFLFLL